MESDQELLRRFQNGDETAATELYLRYARRLLALVKSRCSTIVARREEAEDLVQSTFRRFFAQAQSCSYDVPEGKDLWQLLLVIALNRIRNAEVYHRASKRDARMTLDGQLAHESLEACSAPEASDSGSWQLAVDEALESFPPEHRQVVELRVHGFQVREIARRARCSPRSVERILQVSRTWLETEFEMVSKPTAQGCVQ